MRIANFIVDNILTQAPTAIVSITMLGLLLQREPTGQVISGILETLLGFVVLSAGSSMVVQTFIYFGAIFTRGFGVRGLVPFIEAINGQVMGELGLGGETVLTLRTIFISNVIIACFTKWRHISLTEQTLPWMLAICAIFGYQRGLRRATLILVDGLIGGVLTVTMPAIAQPYVRKIIGNDDIAFGYFCTVSYVLTAWVGRLTGDKGSVSMEELQLPKGLEFSQDTYLSISTVIIPLFLITAFFTGSGLCAGYAGATNYLVYAFLQAIQFVIGIYVLLAGIRLLLAETVPASRDITAKLVPDAKLALNCPVLFPYAPNAVIIGSVSMAISSVIGMFLFPTFGPPVILPGMMTNLFAEGCTEIFGDAMEGTGGCIISGIIHSLLIALLPAALSPVLAGIGLLNATYTNVDTIVCGLLYGWPLKPVLGLF